MNKILKRSLSALFVFAMLLTTGCGGDGGESSLPSDGTGTTGVGVSTGSGADSTGTPGDTTGASGEATGTESGTTSPGGSHVQGTANGGGTTQAPTGGGSGTGSSGTGGAIDYTVGQKPAKRATKINGFVRRAGKYLIDEAGDEWFVKGGGIDCGSLAGKLVPNDTYCNEAMYKAHADIGCNTIRLTFNWEIFFTSKNSNKFNENGFTWLAKNVEWAKKYNIRLILNMHRIPCDDEATGNMHGPMIFWNEGYQTKWLTVWREIAKRFANEPVILAYSFWNEQNAPITGATQADSEKAYGDLYQRCIDVVRAVDTKHVIVCEQMFAQQNQQGAYRHTTFPAFPELKEDNLMYEYHCYEPMEFTYQDKSANQQMFGVKYGDANIVSAAGLFEHKNNESSNNSVNGQKLNSGWSTLNSDVFTADSKTVAGSPLFYFSGSSGTGYVEIQWVEIWDDTTGQKIYRKDFPDVNSIKSYFTYQSATRKQANGALHFTNITGSMVVQNDRVEIVKLTAGHKYRTVASVRGGNLPNDCNLRAGLRFWGSHYGKAFTNSKEALEIFHKPYIEYRDKNNIPVFCGEWGAYTDCYTPGLNSEQWAKDMLTVMKEQNMYFTVHTPYAMYGPTMKPWETNGAGYTVLEDAFKQILPTI